MELQLNEKKLAPFLFQYFPIPAVEQSSSEKLNPAPYVRILQLIDNKYPANERGDVLIFMSGIKEITTIVDACKEYAEKNQVREFNWVPSGCRCSL